MVAVQRTDAILQQEGNFIVLKLNRKEYKHQIKPN